MAEDLGIQLLSYKEAVALAFHRIEQNMVVSSWKDAFSSFDTDPKLMDYLKVPIYGCFKDEKIRNISGNEAVVLDRIWRIGGETGWYYGNFLWKLRGLLDKVVGGVGLRRGRTHPDRIRAGDALDFWRVLLADRAQGRLLLFAERNFPGRPGWSFGSYPPIKAPNCGKQPPSVRAASGAGYIGTASCRSIILFLMG